MADEMIQVPCTKPRGHKGRMHSNPMVKRRWEDGINKAAHWEIIDDGYMSEGEWLAYGWAMRGLL